MSQCRELEQLQNMESKEEGCELGGGDRTRPAEIRQGGEEWKDKGSQAAGRDLR